jgi:ATP-dependent Zn protease
MQNPNGNKPSRNPLRGPDRNQGREPGQGKRQGRRTPEAAYPTWIVGVLILGLLAWNAWRIFGPDDGESRITVPYSALISQVDAGNVSEVTISDTHVNADLDQQIVFDSDTNQIVTNPPADAPSSFSEDTEIRAELPPATDISVSLLPLLEAQDVTITGEHDNGSIWTGILISFLPALLIIGLFVFMAARCRAASRTSSLRPQPRPSARSGASAGHLRGCRGEDEAKTELTEVVDFSATRRSTTRSVPGCRAVSSSLDLRARARP